MRWRKTNRDVVSEFYEAALASVQQIQDELPSLLSRARIDLGEFQSYTLERAQDLQAKVDDTHSANEHQLATAAMMLASFEFDEHEEVAEGCGKSMERVYEEEWVSPLRDVVSSGRRSIGRSRRLRLQLLEFATSRRNDCPSGGGLEARKERVARDAVLLMASIYLDR